MNRLFALWVSTVCLAGVRPAMMPKMLTAGEPAHKAETAKARDQPGADAWKLTILDPQIQVRMGLGDFSGAARLAEEAYNIRRRTQGETHWMTVDARWKWLVCEAMKDKPSKERADLAWALRIHAAATGRLARTSQQLRKEEKSLEKALAICRTLLGEEHLYTGFVHGNLADNLNAQGKYREAAEGFHKSLAIRRKVQGEEDPDIAAIYNNLAGNLGAQGKYREAEESLRKALAVLRKVMGEEHPDTALAYNNLAVILSEQGKYREAEEGHRKALAIYRHLLRHERIATIYLNLASDLEAQGKYREAEEDYRNALAILRKALGEENHLTALGYAKLAFNQQAQGKYREAEEGHRKALVILRKVMGEEHPDTAFSYSYLAGNLDGQGRYKEAEEGHRKVLAILRKALEEAHPHMAASYNALALNLNAQGKYREAEIFFLRAADSFARARLHVAATGLERAAFTSERSPLPRLAAVLARNGRPADAWQRFEESLARGTWDDLTARLRRTLDERAKQSQLVSRIDRLNKLIEKTISAKQPTPEQTRQREVLLTQFRRAQDDLAAFTHELEQKYGPVAGQVLNRKEIKDALPADAALIGWLDLAGQPRAADPDGEHWAVLLRSDRAPVWVRLRGSGDRDAWTDADTQLPARLRAALQSPRAKWQPLAQRLRQQRLQPLAKHLEGVRRLIVLPATALAGVPVEVIAGGYTVSYAHSGSMYAYLRGMEAPTGKGLLALADPAFDTPSDKDQSRPLASRGGDEGGWDRLPGTRSEAAALRRLFDGRPSRLLVDSDASEQRLNELAASGELGKYRYLHLATHGEVHDTFPLRSAVILARDRLPDDQERTGLLLAGKPIADGRLTAEEVLRRWELHCDLVTLSACQTALGKYERGEGFVGFAQALVLSGSRSVCLSLWKVDDTATALLMERFYQNLLGRREGLSSPMTKAAALAEAKAWLRTLPRMEAVKRAASLSQGVARGKRLALPPLEAPPPRPTPAATTEDRPFAHPYYWAAFVLIGHAD